MSSRVIASTSYWLFRSPIALNWTGQIRCFAHCSLSRLRQPQMYIVVVFFSGCPLRTSGVIHIWNHRILGKPFSFSGRRVAGSTVFPTRVFVPTTGSRSPSPPGTKPETLERRQGKMHGEWCAGLPASTSIQQAWTGTPLERLCFTRCSILALIHALALDDRHPPPRRSLVEHARNGRQPGTLKFDRRQSRRLLLGQRPGQLLRSRLPPAGQEGMSALEAFSTTLSLPCHSAALKKCPFTQPAHVP